MYQSTRCEIPENPNLYQQYNATFSNSTVFFFVSEKFIICSLNKKIILEICVKSRYDEIRVSQGGCLCTLAQF
jgi:hypothetical protein